MNQGNLDRVITVAYVNKKPKRSTVKDTDGNLYGVFPDLVGLFQKGSRYDVELKEVPLDGGTVLTNITDARLLAAGAPVNSSAASTTSPPVPASNGNGAKDEQIFVCALAKAFIQAGQIEPEFDQVKALVTMLTKVYRETQ